MNTNDQAHFCPQCGGASLDVSALIGGGASCKTCSWTGKTEELATVPFTHDFASPEEMVRIFMQDLRKSIGPQVTDLARVLSKWGFFLSPNPSKEELLRYLNALLRGMATAVFHERELIEKERTNGPNN